MGDSWRHLWTRLLLVPALWFILPSGCPSICVHWISPVRVDILSLQCLPRIPTLPDFFFLFILFPLVFQIRIGALMTSLSGPPSSQVKDEPSLNTCCVLSALERGGEKCFTGIWDVYNVDFVYFLMCFYEPKKKRKSLFPFLAGVSSLRRICCLRDFPDNPVVKASPSNAGSVGLNQDWIAKIPHASGPKNRNVKQRRYCIKFNEDFKNGLVYIKKKKIF